MLPMQPFAHETFRCPRCGSGEGESCRCSERHMDFQPPRADPAKLHSLVPTPVNPNSAFPPKLAWER
jgi:hypothetical protein